MDQRHLIFVVDDDKSIRDSMSDVLMEKGYNVMTAGDGKEALEKIDKNPPDLIILDMNMPNVGGIAFYSRICDKNNVPKFPVFVLTGRAELEKLFKDFIVQGFMTKPFNWEKLLYEINLIVKTQEDDKKIRSKEIVIVDDETEAGDFLTNRFNQAGYTATTIRTGVDAVLKLCLKPEGVVLINLGLNDLAGDVVALQLKHIRRTSRLQVFLYVHQTDKLQGAVIEHLKEKNGVRDVIVFREYIEIFETIDQRIKEGVE